MKYWLLLLLLCTNAFALDADEAARFAALALECVHQEYPNKISHVLASDDDVAPPRELTPIFYGCFDWHSSVHGHWLLARLAREFPQAAFTPAALTALDKSFSDSAAAQELIYLSRENRASFERPYGLAWLLQLTAELREWDTVTTRSWVAMLEPIEQEAAARFKSWVPKLDYPIRTGEHSQTAFAFGLALDWARVAGDVELAQLLNKRIVELYGADRNCPINYEPSGQDFLSPCLAEADLMRRVMKADQFAAWLENFLPWIPTGFESNWLPVASVSDRSDGKLAHLDGLNLSRAWMLEGIAASLPDGDSRCEALLSVANVHRSTALPAVSSEYYEGGHWLGSFATYLVTTRGFADKRAECVSQK
ncbi:MAG: DUF2891 domain-containing protein [Gammaproteobacteria bacterium]|nr:DUF2891 domain-containing protein [Gammaproteobacteria bacterium]MDH3769232.1 DUF2891 domain-containing protein [Gammaproteobacteria bacterium]